MISAAFVETRVHASCILLAAGSATKYPGAAVILNKKQSKFNWNVSRYFRSWCRSYYAILTTLCIIRARVPTSLSLSLRFLLFQKTFIFHFTRGSDVFSAFQRSLQTGMSFRCTFIKPLYRCRLCADTYGPRVSFSSFSPGPFCDTIRESHSLPMKITAEFSGEFRALRCT